jgi:class 3 adenylate cyclase/predicted ATPase
MQQIADWLQKLALGQYAQTFAENEIDVSVLPHLTDQDLKDMGVPLGPRRKILAAITAEIGTTNATPEPAASIEPKPQDTAERRQVTVMFSDLVGSTALSTRMDPEDLREVISAYQRCVAETVQRFGGFVAKYMGDGVLVYFGYPQAHEDDAERAVRAGLELVAAVSSLKTHAPLQTRVGMATGLVVVGDLIGSGASQEQAIVGETPNLAARLQGVAEPNSVVIAESTRKLVGNLFELEDLGAKDLKGIGPVRVWSALRAGSAEGRFEAFHGTGLTDLVGREEELELLLRHWSKAKTGEGQVVLLSGEPGIGKSRLTAALLERLAAEPHTRLRYFCSPQHTDSALYPIISHMERAAAFAHDDTAQTKLDKLDAVLTHSSTHRRDAALFAEMLSLPNDGRYPTLDLAAQQRRQRTLEALTVQVEMLSRANPVLMIFEDVHWIDPTSLEALDRTLDRLRTLGVLLIVTYRPEFGPPWIGRPYVTALAINRLGEREIAALIDRVTGNKQLPATIRQGIIERTDGIPLFVEEVTKAALEAGGGEDAAERAVAAIPSPSVSVPASLHASLMARLDRLGSAKEVAQIGAAIGREFSHALLAAVDRRPDVELQSALDRLIAAGLLFSQGVPPYATYLFKHALVQDAAYGTLLREQRRALHARIAETLEGQFAENAQSQPELVARHCSEAGLVEKAAGLWGEAGQRSLERSALVEGVAQLTRALDQFATLPATAALRCEQIKLQVALITPVIHVKGYAAPETKAAVERAGALIEQAEALGEPAEPLLLFSVLYGGWAANFVAFNGDVMRELAAQFLALAEKQGTTAPLLIAHRVTGISLLHTADIAESREHFDRTNALYDPAEHRPLATRFGVDARVSVLSYRSWALWLLGYPDAAFGDADQALRDAREIGHAATLMFALALAPQAHFLSANYATTSAATDELAALANEKGALFWKASGMMRRGWLFAVTGKAADAVQMITSGIAARQSTGSTVYLPFSLSHLAMAHAELCQFDDAWRCIGEALKAIETAKEKWCEAETSRIAGEIALKSPERDAAKAEAYFERSLAVARQQQAKSWELRASTSLARLWRDQGKAQQARELLAPVYGWFTEGFDTRDLKEAKALLEKLASTGVGGLRPLGEAPSDIS